MEKERVIVLCDEYGELFCTTNAPSKAIENAIDYKNELLENGEYICDFECMQEYLSNLGYTLSEMEKEKYYW